MTLEFPSAAFDDAVDWGRFGLWLAPLFSVATALGKLMWFALTRAEGAPPDSDMMASISVCVLLDAVMLPSFAGVLFRARESSEEAAEVKSVAADAWSWLAMIGVLSAALAPGWAVRGACAALGVLGGYLAFRAEGSNRPWSRVAASGYGIATLGVGLFIGLAMVAERSLLLDPGFQAVSRLDMARYCGVHRADPPEEAGLAMWELRCGGPPYPVGWDSVQQRVIQGEELRSRRGH